MFAPRRYTTLASSEVLVPSAELLNRRAPVSAAPPEMVFEPRLDQNCAGVGGRFQKLCAWERRFRSSAELWS
jgi:hypothetical protein